MNQNRSTTITNSQLKEGYKQTEVGIIPEDWQIKPLSIITSEIGDGIHSTPIYSNNGEYFFVNGNNIQNGHICLTKETKQSELSEFNKYKKNLNERTILLSINGTIGNVAFYDNEKIFLGKSAAYLNVEGGFSKRFIYYCIQTETVKRSFNDGLTGTTIKNLGLGTIRNTIIAIPPTKAEQEAIACTLSDIDALIESLDRLLTKKRQIKQGAMQELLRSKEGWVVKRLGEICEIGMGRTPPRLNGAFWGKGYKWLSIADLKSKVVNESKEEITSLAAADMKIIPKGTLLMSFKLSLGRLCFAGCDLFTNEAICSFNQLQANAEFLYYVLGRTDFSLYGKQAVKGYTLNKESLNLIEVNLPSIPEQIEIANILSDMDAEIGSIESKLTKTRQLKQGMMHELLTGKIRLVSHS
jgi:type I restriction enzyme, S subunit